MDIAAILKALVLISEIAEKTIPILALITEIEAKAGKKIGDMTDAELAVLLAHATKTPDELIGNVDP